MIVLGDHIDTAHHAGERYLIGSKSEAISVVIATNGGSLLLVTTATEDLDIPVASAADTVDQIVAASRRTGKGFPLRRTFIQRSDNNGDIRPGPLAALVAAGDQRGLLLFLLLLTKASSKPWDAGLPAAVWARALGLDLPNSKTATSTVSKIWLRLERHQLVTREHRRRMAIVTLLREDGTAAAYSLPGETGESYLKVPFALWQTGPDDDHRWYQVLTLPELAVLLIACSHGDGFRLPLEKGPDWFGISADTLARGINRLGKRGLLATDKTYKKAPFSPVGYTAEHRYTLQAPFGPVGKPSRSRPTARTRVS